MVRRKADPLPRSYDVQTNLDGKTYKGTYTVKDGAITVTYMGRTKTTQLGGLAGSPGSLATAMLSELIRELVGHRLNQ